MGIDPTCAARIRRLYFDQKHGIAPIAALTGQTHYAVEQLIKRRGWNVARAAMKSSARVTVCDDNAIDEVSKAAAGNILPAKTTTEGDLVQRLYNAIDETLAEIEKPAAKSAKAGGEYDRKTRAISSMVRSLEKVLEIKVKQAQANDQSGGVAAEKVRVDAEQLRRDIAERLERLQRKRKSQSPSR